MSAQPIFLSHASADDAVVAKLRDYLQALGVAVWTDSQYLSAGVPLEARIFEAIEKADHFVVLVSPKALASKWVEKEIKHARKVRKQRGDSYKVIPILLDGLPPSVLPGLFGKEPVAVLLSSAPGGVEKALPDLLAALGLQLPDDPQPPAAKSAAPIAELTLTLADPSIDRTGGKHRAAAVATLTFSPPDGTPRVESRRFRFTAPLGPIEAEDLAWYLERYAHWPSGPFQDRARAVERKLPEWGQLLYAVVSDAEARTVVEAWQAAGKNHPRRFTVLVDPEPVAGSPAEAQPDAAEAATLLLGLPWELVHDGHDYLFQAAPGVHVRRRLPNREQRDPVVTDPPVRVLLVSPRPEDDEAGYIDHRVSARPLAEALARLGELAQLTLLAPPTFAALEAELRRAHEAGTPYHVVHFDGHGVYDKRHGLGALCFEHEEDKTKLNQRRSDLVGADQLARVVQKYRVPLFFLEACQTAMAQIDPTASVAGKLLQHGVNSVVAMSHTVLVETARRFVSAFYVALLEGQRVGQAMLVGQRALKADTRRGRAFTGPLHLEDWFVPVLFQEELDPQLIREVPAAKVQAILKRQRELALGKVPPEPEQTFVGRSRGLLAAERLLEREPYAVLRGQGGEGKTTLAAELARWLVATHRFRRAAFVSLETHSEARSVLFALGEQLVPNYVTETAQDEKRGLQLIERALAEQPTLLVFDNLESVLPPAPGSPAEAAYEPEVLDKILQLCARLGRVGRTRLVFTSRERMPKPFDKNHVTIDRLDRPDAVALVGKVLGENELMPHAADLGESEAEINDLVEAVNCHARSLVLLPREIVKSGVRNATRQLHELMAALHRDHPDDRERSLLASVELSLRRLPAAMRQKIRPLGVFQGGGHLGVMAMVLGLNAEKGEVVEIAEQLVAVGLAETQSYGYLQLNPALGPALLGALNDAEREAAQAAWAEATAQFTAFLYQQVSKAPQMALTLALLDLPNLVAGLEHLHKTADGDRVVGVATRVETLVAQLGRPKALARAAKVRTEATPKPGEWNHAAHQAASAAVDQLLAAGLYAQAVAAAQAQLQKAQAAGENAYPDAAYDLADTHFGLGRALEQSGNSEAALEVIDESRRCFEALAKAGNKSAARMANVCLAEAGDCLRALGRLDEAADSYELNIKGAEELGDPRQVAVGKGQLGSVRILQRKYQDALTAYTETRETFEKLGEPGSVAIVWHQIGIVHREAQQYEAAERAYQKSLQIKVQLGNRSGEANTLHELGTLYAVMSRLEGAVQFYRQASVIYLELEDLADEGRARNNVAATLIKLERYDEARKELLRAIECDKLFGHAVEPWKTFDSLCYLERAVGNPGAAEAARQQAVQAYLAYRRAGGENQNFGGQLAAAVAAAIAEGRIDAVATQFKELLQKADLPGYLKALIPALQAILAGARDPALAADPNLDYDDAAEVLLLLESLGPAAA
jgi:tetratricopeptide (TPR) repeat protein